MLESFYSSVSGMLTQQRILSTLSNNIVNSKTPGFKEERVVTTTFQQALVSRLENGEKTPIGKGDPIRLVEDVISDLNSSSLEQTGRPFDIGIVGNGFFNIEGENQQFLTRNGNFNIDEEGYLVLNGAGRVLGQEGPIQVLSSDFTVLSDGTVQDSEGMIIDTLFITQPSQDEQLVKFKNGLYIAPEEQEQLDVREYNTQQNHLEAANYDINREYSLIMEAQRAFQACSSALRMIDSVNQKTATQIGSI